MDVLFSQIELFKVQELGFVDMHISHAISIYFNFFARACAAWCVHVYLHACAYMYVHV